MIKMYLALGNDEWYALSVVTDKAGIHPRQFIRELLREKLGLAQENTTSQEIHNRIDVRQDTHDAVVA